MSTSKPARALITSALPYITGDIHLGHLVEHVQTNVFVRFRRMVGDEIAYLCADDVHGTGTMITARKQGVSEADLIARLGKAHVEDLAAFDVVFDRYGSTDVAANREVVYGIWRNLRASGHVAEREVTQLFDPEAGCFLADRFVKGTCPVCGAPDQYGDSCDRCSATYAPTDLKDARSTLSGATPELRSAKHYFVKLEELRPVIEAWVDGPGHLHPDTARWVRNTFLVAGQPLREWDVSRPAPYFGFEIPDAPGNYFYVWLDAPCGYLATAIDWCSANGIDLATWWPRQGQPGFAAEQSGFAGGQPEIHHFIGKDIVYFHTLFWPATLQAGGWKLPSRVHVHGFLTVNGEKMSKSKGTFVNARTYLDAGLDPAHLRYFLASKLNGTSDDFDLSLAEFEAKVNSDVVGKVVNLASRTARFVPSLAATYPDDGGLFAAAAQAGTDIARDYAATDFASAIRRIMALADRANEYVERAAPWALKKDPARAVELAQVCTVALNLFRQLAVYLAPVLPRLAEQAGQLLGAPITRWDDAQRPVTGQPIGPFGRLTDRVDPAKLAKMIELSLPKEVPAPAVPAAAAAVSATPAEPVAATIAYDDFAKVDLRVARIVTAEEVPKAKKILKLTCDLGSLGQRTIFAGIKAGYPEPAKLANRLIVVCANLAPRQMSFGLSEGMALAAGGSQPQELFLLGPDAGAQPGQRVM